MAMLRAVAYHMSAHEDLAAFLGDCTCGQLMLRLTPGFLFPQLAYVKVSNVYQHSTNLAINVYVALYQATMVDS
jgi:hypothetical protein